MSATLYLTTAGVLVVALGLCVVATLRGSLLARLVALEMAGVITTLLLVVLSVAEHRPSYLVVALSLAALAPPGTLIFAHVIERWLQEEL